MLNNIPKLFKVTLTLLIGATLFTACDDDSSGPSDDLTVMESIQTEDNLSSANDLINDYELADTLSQDEPFTVFAPTNEAVESLDMDGMSDEEIKAALQYHIVAQSINFDKLKGTESLETLNGEMLTFSTENDTVTINGGQATITAAGIDAINGTVFKVDSVLSATAE